MKRLSLWLLLLLSAVLVSACANSTKADSSSADSEQANPAPANATAPAADQTAKQPGKALILYYSWSGNTEKVAKEIQKQTSADIAKIEPAAAYPTEYQACVDQARAEKAQNSRPKVTNKLDNLQKYDRIYLGFPNWCSSCPMFILTVLENGDFEGKTIAPFVTHGGGGQAQCLADITKACPKATITKALVIPGDQADKSAAEVTTWLQSL